MSLFRRSVKPTSGTAPLPIGSFSLRNRSRIKLQLRNPTAGVRHTLFVFSAKRRSSAINQNFNCSAKSNFWPDPRPSKWRQTFKTERLGTFAYFHRGIRKTKGWYLNGWLDTDRLEEENTRKHLHSQTERRVRFGKEIQKFLMLTNIYVAPLLVKYNNKI